MCAAKEENTEPIGSSCPYAFKSSHEIKVRLEASGGFKKLL